MINNNEIESAISLLRDNDYIVIKMTPQMNADADECERMSGEDIDKDCVGYACNRCLIQ